MTKVRSNPVVSGAVGAVAGTIIGAATGVLLTDRKARKAVLSKLGDVREYAEKTFSAMSEATSGQQRLAKVGIKGGASKVKSGVGKILKQGNRNNRKRRS